ncbi:ribosome maturation factor RimP, partial [Streptococcus pyogenes]
MDSQGPIILEKSIKIEEVIKIANTSIIDIVTKTVTPEIKAPYELVDVEYD